MPYTLVYGRGLPAPRFSEADRLPVLCQKLVVVPRVRARRAGGESLRTLVQVTAVAAAPYHRLVFLENGIRLHVGEKPQIALLMLSLGHHDGLPYLCYL